MSVIQKSPGNPWLYDDVSGDIVGIKDPDGSELMLQRVPHYGLFYDLTDQSDGVNTPNAITFNTPVTQEGITMVDGSKITFSRGGKFKFTLTAQVQNADNQAHNFYLWGMANGANMPNTLTRLSVPASHGGLPGAIVMERSYFGEVSAGMYIQVMWMTDDSNVTLQYTAAQAGPPALPATPSVYLAVHEVAK